MEFRIRHMPKAWLCCVIGVGLVCPAVNAQPTLRVPEPILSLKGAPEIYETGGKTFKKYHFEIVNRSEFPPELFAPAPDLPPCGTNTRASRTWIDFYTSKGTRFYGHCAIYKIEGLADVWFALEVDVIPPSWVYMELLDRKTNTKYRSRETETTQ